MLVETITSVIYQGIMNRITVTRAFSNMRGKHHHALERLTDSFKKGLKTIQSLNLERFSGIDPTSLRIHRQGRVDCGVADDAPLSE